jgi:hypothetical protein
VERRKKNRFKKRVAISVDGKPAILNNISQEGIQVSMSGMPVSRNVKVVMQMDDFSIEVHGVVMWVKKNTFLYQPNLFGISITTSSPEYTQLVAKQQIPC